ncbi:MAG: hypothetical protein HY673_10205, partial [Chloroflexi bacterium]|nr:hypothetical protein [Chloroflexota bacterium]
MSCWAAHAKLWKIKTVKTGTPDTTLQQANHTWDAGGNLTKREDLLPAQAETETFAYDFLDRLTSETNFLFKFGDTGPSSTVSTPWHAETNSSGNTWVADWGNYRIAEYTSTGQFVGSFGEQQLGSPTGVTRDGDGNFYVSDFWNDKIYKFTSTGNFAWEKGGYGSGNEQFKHPADVVFISSNNNAYIYVADQYNSRVQYFDTSGNYVGTIGGFGSANGQMKYPGGVGRDVQGNLYVADTVNQRIQKFTSDGTHLATFGGPPAGSGDGQFSAPRDVAVDSSGNIFVADTGNHRIQKLSPTGVFITKWGAQGSNPGQFDSPYGVNLASGRIYVVDYNNSRLQTFDLSTTTAWSYNPVGNMTSRDGLAYT